MLRIVYDVGVEGTIRRATCKGISLWALRWHGRRLRAVDEGDVHPKQHPLWNSILFILYMGNGWTVPKFKIAITAGPVCGPQQLFYRMGD